MSLFVDLTEQSRDMDTGSTEGDQRPTPHNSTESGGGGDGGGGDEVVREVEELKEKIRILERNNNGDVENHNTKSNYMCFVCRVSVLNVSEWPTCSFFL